MIRLTRKLFVSFDSSSQFNNFTTFLMSFLLLLSSPSTSLAWTVSRYRALPLRKVTGISTRRGMTRHAKRSTLSSLSSLALTTRGSSYFHKYSSSQQELRQNNPYNDHIQLYMTKSSSTTSTTRPFHLMIVESPSKCPTISKIMAQYVADHDLPYDFKVLSCQGHVRNLPKTAQQVKLLKEKQGKKEGRTRDRDKEKFPYSVLGIDLENDYEPTYVLTGKPAVLKELNSFAANAEAVWLATDPDREGEAMAWHLTEVLNLQSASDKNENDDDDKKTAFHRIRFSEITAAAITAALKEQEDNGRLDYNLVKAQETRRILDRLAGFTVSPVLWKKISPGLSAGRVQSVGMALVTARERERLEFLSTQYSTVEGKFRKNNDSHNGHEEEKLSFPAKLYSVNGTTVAASSKDFDSKGCLLKQKNTKNPKCHLQQEDADQLIELFSSEHRPPTDNVIWRVVDVTSTKRTSRPPQPYRTSTLQQDASTKLNMPVQQCMRAAQQLYEQGLISYHRTDSTTMSEDAQKATAAVVKEEYGHHMAVSNSDRNKDSEKEKKNKFTQEAHEAIRPAIQPDGRFLHTEDAKILLVSEPAKRLYKLIRQRTLASHMPAAVSNHTAVLIEGRCGCDSEEETTVVHFRATGRVVVKAGYTVAYNTASKKATTEEEENEGDKNDFDTPLPSLLPGQLLTAKTLTVDNKETQPPNRYTEASFVKLLEAEGVGRPSTYEHIINVLRDRGYALQPKARNKNKYQQYSGASAVAQRAAGTFDEGAARGSLVPSLSAFVVTALLEKHCPTYVDTAFTARMEEQLDLIAAGKALTLSKEPSSTDSRVAYLDEFYAGSNGLATQIKWMDDHVDAAEARRVQLPSLTEEDDAKGNSNGLIEEKDSRDDVGLFIGPWGPYVQKLLTDESDKERGETKDVTAPLPAALAADVASISTASLKHALTIKQSGGTLLGMHPEDERSIFLKTGRFGCYLQWGEDEETNTTTHSLPKEVSNALVQVIKESSLGNFNHQQDNIAGEGGSPLDQNKFIMDVLSLDEAVGYTGLPKTVSTLQGIPIQSNIGPYGPYLKYNNSFVSLLPQDGDVLTIEAETAEKLVLEGIVNKSSRRSRDVLAELGEKDGSMVTVRNGRFGVYIKWKKVNAKIPVEYSENPSDIPLEEAWLLIQAKVSDVKSETKPRKKSGKEVKKSSLTYAIDLPPKPKRPVSAYLQFCALKRPEVVAAAAANTDNKVSLGQISKKLAQLWKETNDRSEYEALFAQDKVRYEKEMAQWSQQQQQTSQRVSADSISNTVTTKASQKKSQKSKRGPSAYVLFCRDVRPTLVDENGNKLSFGETSKKLAAMWKECDEETRSKFEKASDQEKQKLPQL